MCYSKLKFPIIFQMPPISGSLKNNLSRREWMSYNIVETVSFTCFVGWYVVMIVQCYLRSCLYLGNLESRWRGHGHRCGCRHHQSRHRQHLLPDSYSKKLRFVLVWLRGIKKILLSFSKFCTGTIISLCGVISLSKKLSLMWFHAGGRVCSRR